MVDTDLCLPAVVAKLFQRVCLSVCLGACVSTNQKMVVYICLVVWRVFWQSLFVPPTQQNLVSTMALQLLEMQT